MVRLATMFATMNAALLVGFVRWARGSQRAAWDRTARAADVLPRTIPLPRPQDETLSDLALDETQEIPALKPQAVEVGEPTGVPA